MDLVFLYSVFCTIYMNTYPIEEKKEHRTVNFLWENKLLVFLGNKESLNPYVELHPKVPAAVYCIMAICFITPCPSQPWGIV